MLLTVISFLPVLPYQLNGRDPVKYPHRQDQPHVEAGLLEHGLQNPRLEWKK